MTDDFVQQLAQKISDLLLAEIACDQLGNIEISTSAQRQLEEFCVANGQDIARLDDVINELIVKIAIQVE